MSSKYFAMGALIAATTFSGCAGMSDTERRTTTGA